MVLIVEILKAIPAETKLSCKLFEFIKWLLLVPRETMIVYH
jgi:hypothetical protein